MGRAPLVLAPRGGFTSPLAGGVETLYRRERAPAPQKTQGTASGPPPANVLPFALTQLVHVINAHLWPDVFGEINPTCLECGYACRRVSVKPHVFYAFRLSGEAVVPEVRPVGLLAAAWLGFGEVVSGQRRIRPCEVCGQWMDITDTARPTAKRMHERCAHARRVRRWRQAKRERGSEGRP